MTGVAGPGCVGLYHHHAVYREECGDENKEQEEMKGDRPATNIFLFTRSGETYTS
jgi:hypothetical protein